jgi:hypothetical protein
MKMSVGQMCRLTIPSPKAQDQKGTGHRLQSGFRDQNQFRLRSCRAFHSSRAKYVVNLSPILDPEHFRPDTEQFASASSKLRCTWINSFPSFTYKKNRHPAMTGIVDISGHLSPFENVPQTTRLVTILRAFPLSRHHLNGER